MPTATIDTARAEAITGWMSRGELRWLAEHALTAKTIIEIGSFQGRSTRALADHCPGVVFAVDPWSDYANDDNSQATWIHNHGGSWEAIAAAFHEHLADHLATGRVIPITKPSTIARLVLGAPVDLVFIDGDHRYEACKQDIELYRDLVRPGGILAGHDYGRSDWPGVERAVTELLGQVHRCDSIWWVVR